MNKITFPTAAPVTARAKAKPQSMPMWLRRAHVYCGALFAPAFLFFAITGFAQVYHWHKVENGARPSPLVLAAAQLHKDQAFKSDPASPAKGEAREKPAIAKPLPRQSVSQILLKAFAAAASVALAASTLIGLCLAARSPRDRAISAALFAGGLLVPVALLFA